MRTPGTIALALFSTLAVFVPTAGAAPLSMTFTEARANVGVQLSDEALFEAPDTAPFEAQIDPGSGSITAGSLEFPNFFTPIAEPIVADVTFDFEFGTFTGKFTQATGELTLKGELGGTLTAENETYEGEECFVSTTPEIVELSTAGEAAEGGSPRSGARFTTGLGGPGSIAGEWTDMQAEPVNPLDAENVTFCGNVETRIGGPGGLWLEHEGGVLPPPEQQSPNTSPTPTPVPACVVPKLAGKTLKAAKRKIKAANCKLGKIRKARRPRGLKGPWLLVVKSQSPEPGSSPVNGRVHLRLGPKS